MRDAHHGNGPLATRQTRLTTVAVDIDALTAAASRGFLTSCSRRLQVLQTTSKLDRQPEQQVEPGATKSRGEASSL